MRAPIAVALDAPSDSIAMEWARAVEPVVTTAKIGLELFVRYGPAVVDAVRRAAPTLEIFLDLKLHDIPNTVAGAVRSVAEISPNILTVHASGGSAMVAAAVKELPTTQIAAVTILTSLSDADLRELKFALDAQSQAVHLATVAVAAGAQAIVCSPGEVRLMRKSLGPQVRLITPGVRPSGAQVQDQVRVATPQQALDDGADLLVVGRPITGAYAGDGLAGVAKAAAEIAASIR